MVTAIQCEGLYINAPSASYQGLWLHRTLIHIKNLTISGLVDRWRSIGYEVIGLMDQYPNVILRLLWQERISKSAGIVGYMIDGPYHRMLQHRQYK